MRIRQLLLLLLIGNEFDMLANGHNANWGRAWELVGGSWTSCLDFTYGTEIRRLILTHPIVVIIFAPVEANNGCQPWRRFSPFMAEILRILGQSPGNRLLILAVISK